MDLPDPGRSTPDDRIRWVEHPGGAGTSVLLLHGLGSSAEDWLFQIPALTRHHRVAAVDLPGHGGMPVLPGWPTIGDYAKLVAEAAQEHGRTPAHVVGLSLGGAVALQLAIEFPSYVRSLTLVNTFDRLRLTPAALLRGTVRLALVVSGHMDRLGQWVADGLFPRADQAALRAAGATRIASNPRRGYLQALWAVARFDARPELASIRLPTLVVGGLRDTTVPRRGSLELARRIPQARLRWLEGAGHVATVDSADELNAILLSFLSEVEAAPAMI
jgi:3-oxoadipate enol-lactonase